MDKILVTTDLSKNSKAALRFAISLAQQNKAELIFLHVHYVLRASTWTDNNYKAYVEQNEQNLVEELAGFVGGVYRAMKVKPKAYRCDVYHAYGVPESIEQYAKDNGCNYICISTKGAGNVERLWGTNTGKLIRTSSIPVLCIPSNYRAKPITKVLYAADMENYEKELEQVVAFTKPLKASLEMLHMAYAYELLINEQITEKDLKNKFGYKVDLHYQNRDLLLSLATDMRLAIFKSKPSVLVMFTQQDRSFLDRMLEGSLTLDFSHMAKLPLLSFKKP